MQTQREKTRVDDPMLLARLRDRDETAIEQLVDRHYASTLAAHDLDGSGVINWDVEVLSALGDAGPAGASVAGSGPSFVCPVIRIP